MSNECYDYKPFLKKADKMREIARDKDLHKDDDVYNNIINNIEIHAKEGARSFSIQLLDAQRFYKDENSFKPYKTYLGLGITDKVIDKLKDEGFIIMFEPIVFSFQIDKKCLPIREKEVKNARIIISW